MSDEFAKVVLLEPSWRLYLNRGMRWLKEGDHARALEAFERARQEAPAEPQVLLAVGREQMRQGCYAEAEVVLREAHRQGGNSALVAAALARVLGLHLSKLQEAYQLIDAALQTCDEPAPLHVIRGEILLEEGVYIDARAAFALCLDDPKAAESARLGLARTYNAEGISLSEQSQYEPAIFAFKRAADLDPEWAGPYVNLGVVFGRLNKMGKALQAYEHALERESANPVALFNMGTAQHELGKREEAVCTFEELLFRAPEYPHVRGALANVLCDLKEFDRAIALFLEELDIDSTCVSCWSSLGLAYICTGNASKGEECLRRALELDPSYFNAISSLATLYIAQKRLDAAQRLLDQAHRLDPQRTAELIASKRHFDVFRHS